MLKKLTAMFALIAPLTMATPALAATATGSQTYDSSKSSWSGDSTDGKIKVYFDTTGGTWQDSGSDTSITTDNGTHDNGTYMVTIPASISFEKMNIGQIDQTVTYNVTVKGAIPSAQTVTLTAETGNKLTSGSSSLTETTTQGKKSWTASETYGSLNEDGGLTGTTATDSIEITGVANSVGKYAGSVGYTASLG